MKKRKRLTYRSKKAVDLPLKKKRLTYRSKKKPIF